MISNKVVGVFLTILIGFLGLVLMFVADTFEVIDLSKTFPFLKPSREPISQKHEPPDALAKEELKKEWARLQEEREKLIQKELELKELGDELSEKEDELNQIAESLKSRENELTVQAEEVQTRREKIKDAAAKFASMPPNSAVDILLGMSDYEIIAIFRQMDADAQEAGEQSTVSFLITLIQGREKDRGAAIMQKMLQDPKLAAGDAQI